MCQCKFVANLIRRNVYNKNLLAKLLTYCCSKVALIETKQSVSDVTTDWPLVSLRLVVILIRPELWDLDAILHKQEAGVAASILLFHLFVSLLQQIHTPKTKLIKGFNILLP